MYKLAKLLLSAPDHESCKKANLGTYILVNYTQLKYP